MKRLLTRICSLLLGLFCCVELVYIPIANFIQFVPRQPTPLPDEILGRHQRVGRVTGNESAQETIDGVGHACDRWAEATAQNQGWSLFAPRFGGAGTFLSLTVTDSNREIVELRSRFEPADVEDYVRFDVANYHLFYREMSYALLYSLWNPESFETQGEEWRQAIQHYVTTFRRSLPAYVRWRLATELPAMSTTTVAINVRVFLPPKLGEDRARPEPLTIPMAQWKSSQPDLLVPYDPVSGTFRE